jgi:protein-tyrosine phosphatase
VTNGTGTTVGSNNEPFRILTVCTGNICRSPMAERLLQSDLDKAFPGQFLVESAGTGALVGSPVDARVADFIRQAGCDADNFVSRQLTPEILKRQDLVLALTREHRSRVVEMSPSMLRKTFTVREFARLLPVIQLDDSLRGPNRWAAVLPKALRARSAQPGEVEDDDVVDPYRRDSEIYERMRSDLTPAISEIMNNLGHQS